MFLIATFSVTHYLVIEGNSAFWLAVTVNNLTPLWCLIGPFLFLYVRSVLTDRTTIKWVDILHTVPFWITLLGALPYILLPFSYKLFVAHRIIEDMNAIKNVKMNWLYRRKSTCW